jgi:hypothetical protein
MTRPAHRKVLECASPLALLSRQPKRQGAAAVQDAVAPFLRACLRLFLAPSLLFLLFMTGCATTRRPSNLPRVASSFPADALIIQRAVLTVHGRQFTLNGYLALSKTGGQRLIIMENFGAVLADALVKPDGKIYVMRSSQFFRPDWIQRYVVADMECIFGDAPDADCPGKMLNPAHFVMQHPGYTLDLQIVETKPGPQPVELFDETKRGSP